MLEIVVDRLGFQTLFIILRTKKITITFPATYRLLSLSNHSLEKIKIYVESSRGTVGTWIFMRTYEKMNDYIWSRKWALWSEIPPFVSFLIKIHPALFFYLFPIPVTANAAISAGKLIRRINFISGTRQIAPPLGKNTSGEHGH